MSSTFTNRLPYLISGVGILLGLVLLGEAIFFAYYSGPAYSAFEIGALTSLPFVVGLVYGGYWVANSKLSPRYYRYVARWWTAVLIVFVPLIVVVNSTVQPLSLPLAIGTIRWSAAIGGTGGLLIGALQATAVKRAIEVETASIRQRQTERERERLNEFASNVSHDLRSQLHVAGAHLEALRDEDDNHHVHEIFSALDRMEDLIEETLVLAQMGRTVGRTSAVELSDVVATCREVVNSNSVTLETLETLSFRADATRLTQLLENLFRNAIEHGGDDVTIRVGVLEDPAGFYVEDDGPGIPEAERDRVFNRGYSTVDANTGFGLSIVREIAAAHGWDIAVTESDEGGARFEITGVEPEAE